MEEKSSNGIMNEYLDLTKEYNQKYGEKTIVLLQVGAFFEVYGLKNSVGVISGSQIVDFSQTCQLNISEKKIVYKSNQVVMAGFRDYSLDKYLQRLTDDGYTAAVFVQEKKGKVIKRVLQGVYSSGTFVSYETELSPKMTNNILCVWIDVYTNRQKQKQIVCGLSALNTFTGKTAIFEYETPFFMNPTTFDEIERFVSIYAPIEVICITPFENDFNRQILQYSGISCSSIHYVHSITNEKAENCTKQSYMKHVLSPYFGEDVMDVCAEFHSSTVATQSFCYLLNFVCEHNINLVRGISFPDFTNTGEKMILANHTLKQLNIIDEENGKMENAGKLSSVSRFLNYCCTPMGKRQFHYQLLSPVFNREWLQREYDRMDNLLASDNEHFIDFFRKQLVQVRDIEKIIRQIVMKKIYPSSLFHLYNSIKVIGQIQVCLVEMSDLSNYLCENQPKKYDKSAVFMEFMDKMFSIEECMLQNSATNMDFQIIKPGVSEVLDKTRQNYSKRIAQVNEIKEHLKEIITTKQISKGFSTANKEIEYIKVYETEKMGISLQITKVRGQLLKEALVNKKGSQIVINSEIVIRSDDIKLVSASTSSYDIEIPELTKICKEILHYKELLSNIVSDVYLDILNRIEENWSEYLGLISNYIARLDILQSKCYVAQKYRYCKPEIDRIITEKSYVDARGIRHCLIERLLQNEVYEKNDVVLGKDQSDGILLYGTNAVGKTSIIRAVGICIIMAQAGMYVPCDSFVYCPYTSIYTRILGNDNLFKGLSTFAVEMSELRIILKMATNQSLILGDELCSGTETESALSIFVAGVMELAQKGASFMFATHFHEIVDYDEIKERPNIRIKHMSVIYDREKDCLIYDRKLRDGQGLKTYGLEVCKSLYLPTEFLENAYAIRNKYFPDTRGGLSGRTSHYNSKKIVGMCEICKVEIADEVHHLQQQKDADSDGYIGNMHKNNIANLVAVCEKCHDDFHANGDELKSKKVKTTKGFILYSPEK